MLQNSDGTCWPPASGFSVASDVSALFFVLLLFVANCTAEIAVDEVNVVRIDGGSHTKSL